MLGSRVTKTKQMHALSKWASFKTNLVVPASEEGPKTPNRKGRMRSEIEVSQMTEHSPEKMRLSFTQNTFRFVEFGLKWLKP